MSNNKGKSWGKCVLESPSLTLFSFFFIISFFFFETENEAAEIAYMCRISPGITIRFRVSKQKRQKLKKSQEANSAVYF